MKHTILATAVALSLTAFPLWSANSADEWGGSTKNMHKNDDGTFQGKPVVEGPADWSHLYPDAAAATSGASTGEGGDSATLPSKNAE